MKIINSLAYNYCWPYGTPKKTYMFETGKPRDTYKKAINEIFPKHNEWSNKRQKNGACCDILTAVELGHIGIKVKKDLKDQLVDMPKMKELKAVNVYKAADFKPGMIIQRGRKDKSGHTYTIFQPINSKELYIANAHYKHLDGCYAVVDAKAKTEDPKKWTYYKCYEVPGAYRTYYTIGDYGYDVLYIQRFLNWVGLKDNNGKVIKLEEDGDYGKKTAEAVSLFQKLVGLKVSGNVGEKTIEKMKQYKK